MKKIFLIFLTWNLTMAQNNVSIEYILNMAKPENHIFEVEMKVSGFSKSEKYFDFQLPVWRTGRYWIFDFASGIISFEANDFKNEKINWEKISKSTWRVKTNNSKSISVKYKVYANEFSSRTRGLNEEHAFIDGTSVFMFIEKFRTNILSLKVNPVKDWHVTTGLAESSKNIFVADSYDILADTPLEIGNQIDLNFLVENIPHTIMIFGENKIPHDTLISDFTKIILQQKNFWGFYPYKKYIFMIHSTPSGGGGTEHLNSTIMGVRPKDLSTIEEYRQKFLGLVVHEFFHTWNVKYLRPKGITPYNFMSENYVKELWISEGSTSYYDELLLARIGLKTGENLLKDFAMRVQSDRSRPGNLVQPVSESSFDAWVKFWRNTPQSYNFESDYYDKGANVSFCLDIELRNLSNNKISLDELFREMAKNFPYGSNGFTNSDFQKTAEKLVKSDLTDFFNNYVFGTSPLPWEKYLNFLGLELIKTDSVQKPIIDIFVNETSDKTIVTNISKNSPFYNSGLDIGDEIISINENRINKNFISATSKLIFNEKVNIIFARVDKIKTVTILLNKNKEPNYIIKKIQNPTTVQKNMFKNWIGEL